MNDPKEEYLGDSVYAEHIHGAIELTTRNGSPDDPSNRIVLEPEVYSALLCFVDSIAPQRPPCIVKAFVDLMTIHRRQVDLLNRASSILNRLPIHLAAKCRVYCEQLDFDGLTREESIEVISELNAGTWKKSVNSCDSTTIDYETAVDGVKIRLWAAAPPDSCRVIEIEEEIPATKIVRRKLVCSEAKL